MFESLFDGGAILGMDFGTDTVKVVQLRRAGKFGKLVGYGAAPIPPGSLTRAGLKDGAKVAAQILEAAHTAKPHALRGNLIATSLPEGLVFSKTLTIPKLATQEIAKSIPYQASEFFPMPPSELVIDWTVLGPTAAGNELDVYVVGAPKKIVESIVGALEEAHLTLARLETTPLAILRALMGTQNKGTWVVLDVGIERTTLSIADNGSLKLTGTVDVGSGDHATPPSLPPIPPKKDQQASPQVTDVTKAQATAPPNLNEVVEPIAQEVLHSIKYFQNRLNPKATVNSVLLTGSGANLTNLVDLLGKRLGTSVQLANPLINLTPGTEKTFPLETARSYTAAIGSALGDTRL